MDFDKIVYKIFSGRYATLMMFGVTYCIVILGTLAMVALGKMDVKFFEGLITGLATTVVMMWKDYNHNNVDQNETDKANGK